jgi:hypothetical protein
MKDSGFLGQSEKLPGDSLGLIPDYLTKLESEAPKLGPTVSQARVESLARHFAASDMTTEDIAAIRDNPRAFAQLQQLARALRIQGSPMLSEVPQIAARVRQLRGEK